MQQASTIKYTFMFFEKPTLLRIVDLSVMACREDMALMSESRIKVIVASVRLTSMISEKGCLL